MNHDRMNETVQRIREILDEAVAGGPAGACCSPTPSEGCCTGGCGPGCCAAAAPVGYGCR